MPLLLWFRGKGPGSRSKVPSGTNNHSLLQQEESQLLGEMADSGTVNRFRNSQTVKDKPGPFHGAPKDTNSPQWWGYIKMTQEWIGHVWDYFSNIFAVYLDCEDNLAYKWAFLSWWPLLCGLEGSVVTVTTLCKVLPLFATLCNSHPLRPCRCDPRTL